MIVNESVKDHVEWKQEKDSRDLDKVKDSLTVRWRQLGTIWSNFGQRQSN